MELDDLKSYAFDVNACPAFKLVGVMDCVEAAVKMVLTGLVKISTAYERVDPLAVSALARGGTVNPPSSHFCLMPSRNVQ